MNRNRKIVVVSVLAIVGLVVTTGWSVLAGEGWPPEPYQTYSMIGTWGKTGNAAADVQSDRVIWAMGAEDPMSGRGTYSMAFVIKDWTQAGQMDADYWTPGLGTYVRTGPDTWSGKLVGYARKNTQPKPTLQFIMVREELMTMTAPDVLEIAYRLAIYTPDQDLNRNGLPDDGQEPLIAFPAATDHLKPL